MITEKEMLEALRFYGIDEAYLPRCVEAAKTVDPARFDELYKIYYEDALSAVRQLYGKTVPEIFGENCSPFITNVMILAGYRLHQKNLEKWQLDPEQLKENMWQVYSSFVNEITERGLPGSRLDYLDWATRFVRMMIIQVGRLKYEVNGDGWISIHIPRRKGFDIADIRKSIEDSRIMLKKMYGLENPPYRCSSWLLSNQVYALIPKDSNIARFHDLFEIEDGKDATEDLLNFVWQTKPGTPITELCEDTSLQRKIKAELLAGRPILIGKGVLK